MTEPERPEWEVFLLDDGGYTERNDELALSLLALWPHEGKIWEQFGDCVPSEIVVSRGSAKPLPQSDAPDEQILRHPAGYLTEDQITFDLEDAGTTEHARLLWIAAQGAAEALNRASA